MQEVSSIFLASTANKGEATSIHCPHPVPDIFRMTDLPDQTSRYPQAYIFILEKTQSFLRVGIHFVLAYQS